MNDVKLRSISNRYTTNELIKFYRTHTAFVGRILDNSLNRLYLLAYSVIVQADDPSCTWSEGTTPSWYVDHFCDVEIKELCYER